VLVRGINDDEAPDLLRFALAQGYELRFIEQMPLDAGHHWSRDRMVTADEILAALEAEFTLLPDPAVRGGAPAETWLVATRLPGPGAGGDGRDMGDPLEAGGLARVGVIASVTRPFCRDCDRTRLTADGQVRACLFSQEETDLRGLLRGGGSDDEIADRWRAAMWGKRAGHGIDDPGFLQPTRPMSAIGG
jgi:cyclic pyranopterin phosphate synthase